MKHKHNAGFSLADVLLIIGIIGILFLVFPFITEILNPHGCGPSALKSKARGVWLAIVTANSERELLEKPPLWPADLIDYLEKEGTPHVTENSTAEEYFNYLMSSNGVDITTVAADRIVGDLKPEMLTAPGLTALPPREKRLGRNNNAWHVVIAGDAAAAETPFLISRNVNLGALAYAQNEDEISPFDDTPMVTLDEKILPFKDKRAVWITKGGSSADARKIMLRRGLLCPLVKPGDDAKLKFLRSSGGAQE